jgi:D-3-phosphoglycerate dehydrogenase
MIGRVQVTCAIWLPWSDVVTKRASVLVLPHPQGERLLKPWVEDIIAAIGERHDVRIFEHSKPLQSQFEGADVVIDHGGAAGTREMMDAAALVPVKLWQVHGTGLDHFDLDYCRVKGIPVAHTPGVFSAIALAECAMMFILMLARRYPVAQDNLRSGRLYDPLGRELGGLKLGIVGFGASGRELARRALPFGMEISVIDVRDVGDDERMEFGLRYVGKPDQLDRMVAESDVLSLHLHLTPQTHHAIDARRIGMMKRDAFLINVARGALVDEAAMIEALIDGRLGGAGLDVFSDEPPDPDSPLFRLPNVIATPHISGGTDGTSRRRAQCSAANVDRIAAGLEPLYRVD